MEVQQKMWYEIKADLSEQSVARKFALFWLNAHQQYHRRFRWFADDSNLESQQVLQYGATVDEYKRRNHNAVQVVVSR